MKMNSIRLYIKRNYILYKMSKFLIRSFYNIIGGVKITNKGKGHFSKDVIGKNNICIVGKDTFFYNSILKIRGNNNKLIIGEGCSIRQNVGFQIDGNDLAIVIGNNTSIQHGTRLHAQKANIFIGNDCMFSNNIFIRTSDSHPIYDVNTGNLINPSKDVVIGDHVWLAANARVFKGASIGNGCVIGAYSLVTKHIPENSIVAGVPAKIVKQNIRWERM